MKAVLLLHIHHSAFIVPLPVHPCLNLSCMERVVTVTSARGLFMTTKTSTRDGKDAKDKAREADAADARSSNGGGATEARPYIMLPPPPAEALSTPDPLNEQGELVCTSETTLKIGRAH